MLCNKERNFNDIQRYLCPLFKTSQVIPSTQYLLLCVKSALATIP